jgi:hypothetical protein
MFTATLKTTEDKLTVTIPSEVKEITMGMMSQLQNDVSDIEAISILSGIEKDTLYTVRKIEDFEVFKPILNNLIKSLTDFSSDLVPLKVTIAGKEIKVNRNLSIEPAGAYMAAKNIIADEINIAQKIDPDNWQTNFNPNIESACRVLAHYFYERVTGKLYNEYRAEEFTEEIKKMSIVEALPVSRCFFLLYPNLSQPKTNFLNLLKHLWKRRQGLRTLSLLE